MGFSSIHRSPRLAPRLVIAAWSLATAAPVAHAQLPHPRLDWIFPPGARIGAEATVEIGGADLDDAAELRFSHPGVTATPARDAPNDLYPDGKLQLNRFQVRVADDVPPGAYEVCSVGAFGVSTPRVFQVGEHQEIVEENTHDAGAGQAISLGTAVSGRADGDAVDYYRVHLEAGQFCRAVVWGRRLDSRIDARIEATDAQGVPLAVARHTDHGDPAIAFTAPATGEYTLAVFDSIYRGGADRWYRLLVDGEPLIAAVAPPAVIPGGQVRGELRGYGIPGAQEEAGRQLLSTIFAADSLAGPHSALPPIWRAPAAVDLESVGVHAVDSSDDYHASLAASVAPFAAEEEPNDLPARAQSVMPPCDVAAWFEGSDEDWFEFDAAAGETWRIDVVAARADEPVDPVLHVQRLTKDDAGAWQVRERFDEDDGAEVGDEPVFGGGSADPRLTVSSAEASRYRVSVRDYYGGDGRPYRLIVTRPEPGFSLIAAPRSPWEANQESPQRWRPAIRRAGRIVMPVVAARRGGFGGPIQLTVEGAPPGVTVEFGVIPAGANRGYVTLVADEDCPPWCSPLHVIGRAEAGGRQLAADAKSAVLIWEPQSPKYFDTRLQHELLAAAIRETAPIRVDAVVDAPLKTARGGTLKIPLQIHTATELKELPALEAVGLPGGVAVAVAYEEGNQRGAAELTFSGEAPIGPLHFLLAGKPKVTYRRNVAAAEAAEQDRVRLEALAAGLEDGPAKQQAEAALAAAAEQAKALAEAAAPKDVVVYAATQVITVEIAESPLEVAAIPERVSVAPGSSAAFDLVVERRFGLEGEITVAVEAGEGLVAEAAAIAADASRTVCRISAAEGFTGERTVAVTISAKLGEVTHEVRREVVVRLANADQTTENAGT